MLVECKPAGASLDTHGSQLYRYFNTTDARLAILTDGIRYRFFTDLREPNRMDAEPFLELDLESPRPAAVTEIARIARDEFDLEAVLAAAAKLAMTRDVRSRLKSEFQTPSDEFVRAIADPVYDGRFTQQVLDRYRSAIQATIAEHVRELVEARLRTALKRAHAEEDLGGTEPAATSESKRTDPSDPEDHRASEEDKRVETTVEEIEGLYAVKAIVRDLVDLDRVFERDGQTYFSVILDNSNRKPICRLWFNGTKKYLGVFDADKNETRIPINKPDNLFDHAQQIRASLDHALKR